MVAECFEKILRKLALKVIHPDAAQLTCNKFGLPRFAGIPGERFVHGHVCRPDRTDPFFIPQPA